MTEPTSENGLQAAIVKAVMRRHPSAWVFHPVGGPWQMTGVPDLILCVEGRFIGLEVKFIRPGESRDHAVSRVTPGQRMQIRKINQAGGVAAAVMSVGEALGVIDRALSRRLPEPDVLQ